MTNASTPDGRCARVAARQRALISHAQAISQGLTQRQIELRVQAGVLIRLVAGLYRYAAAPVTWQQSALAACMAAPAPAVCSHLTAAALLGIGDPPLLPHITVSPGSSARTRLAKVHRSVIDSRDIVVADSIPSTGPGRTLLDCATLITTAALEDMLDEALCRPLSSVAGMHAAIDRTAGRGRNGTAAMRRAIEPWLTGVAPDSPAEMRLLRRIVAWGFPAPVRQHEVFDSSGALVARLDLAWPDSLHGLEYDSERWHGPRRLDRDEAREARLRALGWEIERADRFDLRPGALRLHDVLQRWLSPRAA